MAPGKVQRTKVWCQPTQGHELEDIPDEFDSREVLLDDGVNEGSFFVIKDVAQVLPYCVINLTRDQPSTNFASFLPLIPNQIQMQNSNLNSQQKAPNHASVITYPGQAGSHQAFVAPSNAGINLHSSSSGGPSSTGSTLGP